MHSILSSSDSSVPKRSSPISSQVMLLNLV